MTGVQIQDHYRFLDSKEVHAFSYCCKRFAEPKCLRRIKNTAKVIGVNSYDVVLGLKFCSPQAVLHCWHINDKCLLNLSVWSFKRGQSVTAPRETRVRAKLKASVDNSLLPKKEGCNSCETRRWDRVDHMVYHHANIKDSAQEQTVPDSRSVSSWKRSRIALQVSHCTCAIFSHSFPVLSCPYRSIASRNAECSS